MKIASTKYDKLQGFDGNDHKEGKQSLFPEPK